MYSSAMEPSSSSSKVFTIVNLLRRMTPSSDVLRCPFRYSGPFPSLWPALVMLAAALENDRGRREVQLNEHEVENRANHCNSAHDPSVGLEPPVAQPIILEWLYQQPPSPCPVQPTRSLHSLPFLLQQLYTVLLLFELSFDVSITASSVSL